MDHELKQALEAMEARINTRFEQVSKRFDEMFERISDVETRLLTEFMNYGRTNDLRLKTLPLIDQRIHTLEDRVTQVETKLLQKGL